MATVIEKMEPGYFWRSGRVYRPLDVRLAGIGSSVALGGTTRLANINVNPAVCAAVAGLVGAAGGFFGARGALKGKGLPKKKMQQQIAMYAVGATAVAGLVGYFLCRRPAAPEPVPAPTAPPPITFTPRTMPGPEPPR